MTFTSIEGGLRDWAKTDTNRLSRYVRYYRERPSGSPRRQEANHRELPLVVNTRKSADGFNCPLTLQQYMKDDTTTP